MRKQKIVKSIAKKAGAVLLASTLLITNMPQYVYADYIRGTEDKPVQAGEIIITTADEFNSFASSVTSGESYSGKTVRLGADIDFSGKDVSMAGDGKVSNSFDGTFDGAGYSISGIDTTFRAALSTGNAGLFAVVGEGATIKNVKLNNVTISLTKGDYAGALAGLNEGTIYNCKIVNSFITSTGVKNTGGLVGTAKGGKINYCMNINTSVNADGSTGNGGVVGNLGSGASLSHCGFTGNVEGGKFAGGLAGFMGARTEIERSYAAGYVNSRGKYGAIAGTAQNMISRCYYASDIVEDMYGTDTNLSLSNIRGMSSAEMAAQEFADTLNEADNGNTDAIPWAIKEDCIYPQPADIYSIDKTEMDGGSVNCKYTDAFAGKEISFLAIPSVNYETGNVTVTTSIGESIELVQSDNTYTFIMPESPVVISAEFLSKATPEPEETPEPTQEPVQETTQMPAPTQKATQTPAPTQEATQTPAPTQKATQTPAPTQKATQTPAPTQKATQTPAPTQKATQTPAPTQAPVQISTPEPEETFEPEDVQEPEETQEPEEIPEPDETFEPGETQEPEVKNIEPVLQNKNITIKTGAKKKIKIKGAIVKSKTFKSNNKAVASVNKKGIVTAKKKGKCKIKVVVKYYKNKTSKKVYKKELTVNISVKK